MKSTQYQKYSQEEVIDLIDERDERFQYILEPMSNEDRIEASKREDGWQYLFIYELDMNYRMEMVEILRSEDIQSHYSLNINMTRLLQTEPQLATLLIKYPLVVMEELQRAVTHFQYSLLEFYNEDDPLFFKPNLHVRLVSLPNLPYIQSLNFPCNNDVGKLLTVHGTVVRTGPIKLMENIAVYFCSKCQTNFQVINNLDQYASHQHPLVCLNDNKPDCNGTRFKLVNNLEDTQFYRHYQEIKLQQCMHKLKVGSIPKSLMVILEDDLVDGIKSGDEVYITGILRRRWKPSVIGNRCNLEIYFHANHIKVKNQFDHINLMFKDTIYKFAKFWEDHKYTPLLARDKIIKSFCPKVYGMHPIKLCVLLCLIGGASSQTNSGHKTRGESHLLLVGDPGTGKSQFLKFAAKLITRSVVTTGIGSSSVGLTVAATKDKGEFQLEPGALVLADGGLCCIDEFNSIQEKDRTAIYEAMEQQTISIAKAGMVCKLNSRCSVLAATNPKGKYDPTQSLTSNLALSAPLLSRFDLILIILDDMNPDFDNMITNYLLTEKTTHQKEEFDIEQLKLYLQYIKETFIPKLNRDAEHILTKYYQLMRNQNMDNSRTTIRSLQSMIRLATAHARLCFKNQVEADDACTVVMLMEASMAGLNIIHQLNQQHWLRSEPDENPDVSFKKQKTKILQVLGLDSFSQSFE